MVKIPNDLQMIRQMFRILLKIKRHEEHSSSFVELRLELHPVQPVEKEKLKFDWRHKLQLKSYQPERVKESRESLHEAKNADGEDGPEGKDEIDGDSADAQRIVGEAESDPHHH